MTRYQSELSTAIAAVRAAGNVCQAIQRRMVTPETMQKKDKSPVTVADFASQAIVASHLKRSFPSDPFIGEEDAAELRMDEQSLVRRIVTDHVSTAMGKALDEETVLDWIDHNAQTDSADTSRGRFWTLDPIDGTKGFLRAEQYAVALALIEDGKVVLGVLGCPNLPNAGGPGVLLVATRGGGAQILPLSGESVQGRPALVSDVADAAQARFCESVESGHSDQDQSADIARALGITATAIRMDSQAKYATVARGEAQIYLRLPTRADYEEKIWDHAAGLIAVEEAGGRVTDIAGKPLDFGRGSTLSANKGVVATNGRIHDAVLRALAAKG